MKICFQDSATEAEFNELARLDRRFGPLLAGRIGTRMQVLLAARHLGDVPTGRPIRLRSVAPETAEFSVALNASKRLRFRALCGAQKDGQLVFETVKEIEVLGVDD